MSQEHAKDLVTIAWNCICQRLSWNAHRNATLELGRLAMRGRLQMVGDRIADAAREIRLSAAVEQHLNYLSMAEFAGKMQRQAAQSDVEVAAARYQHSDDLRLGAH